MNPGDIEHWRALLKDDTKTVIKTVSSGLPKAKLR